MTNKAMDRAYRPANAVRVRALPGFKSDAPGFAVRGTMHAQSTHNGIHWLLL